MKTIREKLDDLFDQVSTSKLGPIFYDIKGDDIIPLSRYPLKASNHNGSLFRINAYALEIYKACLFGVIGQNLNATIKEDGPSEAWRGENDNA